MTLPMMMMVVYLSGKLGQMTGLFPVLRSHVPRQTSSVASRC